ncbi:hypothetical protein D9758_010283 [Tetrapyrgos nigripes]|uniref:Uncharacterized protein n=1 Tax=Tetrapyrgos nigripes TaxID=182062 RepID=A0A8H5LL95_9AGAR|nr:hypothetical protein D9758_010283 [Tetrapyrgos nigripes]
MSTSSVSTPMRGPRLVALFMSFAWGVIALAVAISAQVKSDDSEDSLKRLVPQGTTLTINSGDVRSSGTVIAVVSGIIALLSFIYIVLILFFSNLATRSLPIQWASLAFLAVWLFATQIPFTVFFANREAQVTIVANGVTLPSVLVNQLEQSLGVTPVYRHIDYLRLVAVLPWITFLFTVIGAVVSFSASRRRKSFVRNSKV